MVIFLVTLPVFLEVLFGGWYYSVDFYFWEGDHWLQLFGMIRNLFLIPNYQAPPEMAMISIAAMVISVVVMIVLALLMRRVSAKTIHGGFDQKSLHGTARFAGMREMTRAGLLAQTGVVLGRFQKKRLVHDGPEHVLVFAPTRSGKGVSVVVPTLLEWQHSALVLDIKGELFQLTSGYRERSGQRILCFDPSVEISSRFNPLCEVRIGTTHAVSDVERLANILVDPQGQQGDKYFAMEGYVWLSAVILHVLVRTRLEGKPVPRFSDIAGFMSARDFEASHGGAGDDGAFKAMCQFMMAFDHKDDAINNIVQTKAAYMKSMADKQRSGVISMAMLPLQVFQDPLINANTTTSDFTIDSLMDGDNPTTLYLVIPPSDINRLKPLIKMVFEIIIMKRAGRMGATPKQRLLLLMDEFTSIGKLQVFAEAIAYIAGYGMKFVGVIQDFTQLRSVYGKDESIFSNCHVRLAFAPNRYETARTLSEMTGKTTVIQHKRGTSGEGLGKSVSDSANEVARPLLTPEEVMSLRGIEKGRHFSKDRPGQALVFVAGQPPLLADQSLFYQDTVLRGRTEYPAASIESGEQTQTT